MLKSPYPTAHDACCKYTHTFQRSNKIGERIVEEDDANLNLVEMGGVTGRP